MSLRAKLALHPLLANVLLLLATLTVGLAAVELGLRWFAPLRLTGIPEAYEYDAELGYCVRPGIHLLRTTDHQEEVRTNGLGTLNFQEGFEGYERLVLALGDSYTAGTGLPADAAYPFQLDMILNRGEDGLYRPSYGVVNLGLAAFGGEQSARTLERYAERLREPEVVLYLGCDNDWGDDQAFLAGFRHRGLQRGNPHWGIWLRPILWLDDLELFKRTKVAVGKVRLDRLRRASEGAATATSSVAEREWPVLERIATRCRERGALLVVSWSDAPSASYDWLRERARRDGLPFADWLPAFDSMRAAIPALEVNNPHSSGHYRTWVNRLIAEAFAREIERPAELSQSGAQTAVSARSAARSPAR